MPAYRLIGPSELPHDGIQRFATMGALMKHVEQPLASIGRFTVNILYGETRCHTDCRSPVAVSYSPPSYTFFCTGSEPAATILNRGLRVLPQIV